MRHLILLVTIFITVAANAQRYEIGNAKTLLNLNNTTIEDSFTKEAALAIPVYKIETYYEIENRTCTRVECEEREVNDNPTWSGFFTTSNNITKAKILSDLIKGIGLSTAEKIVAYNLIQYRPKSWSSFVNLVKHVEAELLRRGHQHSFTKEVTELYGFDNSKSLGYFVATICRDISYSCQVAILKERKIFAYNIHKNLTVNYAGKGSNTHLYSFETEELEIITEGSGETKVEQKTGFNSFRAEVRTSNQGANIIVNITAGSRNIVNAPSSMFTIATQFKADGAELKITTQGTFTSFFNQSNVVEVTYQVCAKKGLTWSKSECKSPLTSGTAKLAQMDQTISIPFTYVSGAKYYVAFNVKLITSSDFKLGTLAQGASNTYKAP